MADIQTKNCSQSCWIYNSLFYALSRFIYILLLIFASSTYLFLSKIKYLTLQFKQFLNMKRDRVYFDLTIDGKDLPRVIFQLYTDIVPKTVENFKTLCTRSGKEGYGGSSFHRIITNFMAQGGDFTVGNGTGGRSIYGEKFADQNFKVSHTKPYMLSMANAGKNTNGSQFFITFVPCPWLDGKHVVFGEVVDGRASIDLIHKNASSGDGKPKAKVVIKESGVL